MKELKRCVGKTITKLTVAKHEASDQCSYVNVEIHFTDGSYQSLLFNSQPFVEEQFFKSDADGDEIPSRRIV